MIQCRQDLQRDWCFVGSRLFFIGSDFISSLSPVGFAWVDERSVDED
jgi:hypothetical protein